MFGKRVRKIIGCCFYLGISIDQITPAKTSYHFEEVVSFPKTNCFFKSNLVDRSVISFAKSSKNKPKKFREKENKSSK